MASGFEHDAAPLQDPDEKKQKTDVHGHGHSHDHSEGAHALIVALGTVTLGGATFMVDRDGQIEAGKTTEIGVEHVGGTAGVVPSLAWVANPDGQKLCDPVSGEGHDQHWHFNVEPLYPVKNSKLVLSFGEEEASVSWARGSNPVNGGILSVLKADDKPDKPSGFLELKLHGDAGDLELWLYVNTDGLNKKPRPLDVPKETVLSLTFPSHAGKTIEMRVRDMEENADEDGKPNMRQGGTNYFIFPGESGQDPAWLVGETVTSWRGVVSVAFDANGKSYVAEPFVLVPHDAL